MVTLKERNKQNKNLSIKRMNKTLKIYIIIVNYRTEDLIGDAVKSFDEESVDTHIVILDNGSTEESYTALRGVVGDEIEIIRNEKNLGYSAGANYIVKHIQKTYGDMEYFFFFNPDAVATKNMLGLLYKALSKNQKAAAISPLIYDMGGEVFYNGMEIDLDRCFLDNFTKNIPSPDVLREVDSFHGCAVLIDAKKFFEVGMFDEDLFIYYDEPFLSMEFKAKGYVSLFEPKSIAHHHGSYSTGADSPFKNHLMARNHIMFFKKYGTSKKFLCPYLRPMRQILHYLKRFNFKSVQAILVGIIDTVRGKVGAP
ncbi:MAG: glycosyltransferase family 2 protein [Sulfurovum sp.]|nr:glycosyltransferase family 2 protein [Sulfurovum sp.]